MFLGDAEENEHRQNNDEGVRPLCLYRPWSQLAVIPSRLVGDTLDGIEAPTKFLIRSSLNVVPRCASAQLDAECMRLSICQRFQL